MVLNETNTKLLTNAIHKIGVTVTFKLFRRVIEIVDNGGMYTLDNSRKRTPGGIFFYILRDEMTRKEYKKLIYKDEQRKKYKQNKNINKKKNM